jgi:hypothetical protein
MTISRWNPPLDYLQAASRASLQSFELTRLNHAANLRDEIAALIDQWVKDTSEAMLARWMLDHHKASVPPPHSSLEDVPTLINRAVSPTATSPLSVNPAAPRFPGARSCMKSTISNKSHRQRITATG